MSNKKIFTIDDEEPIIKVIKDILEPEGYTIESAINAEEALEKLKSYVPDLILIDFILPGMSGRELAEKIRAESILKDTKIAFITGVSLMPAGMKELEKLNISDFIKKPFQYKDLIERVKKMIG
ncbi:response regulator [candidate division KSB1 bacterium]|nr:response regulator [candidate division KSB1 bacterium]